MELYMDYLDRAIENQRHISKYDYINSQTWDIFEKDLNEKFLFLFGVSNITFQCLKRFIGRIKIHSVIDNDKRKWGISANRILPVELFENAHETVIESPEALLNYESEKIIVLISSINSYDEIADQLAKMGITNYYVMLVMESKIPDSDRKNDGIEAELNIDSKKIVFRSDRPFSGHEKAIILKLIELRKDLHYVYITSDLRADLPENVKFIYSKNIYACRYEICSAKVLIDDCTGNWLDVPDKRNCQIYIQLKHWPSITLKKFCLDMHSVKNNTNYIKNVSRMGKMYDYMIGGSAFDEESCRSGFGFKGIWLNFGSCRTDLLFKNNDEIKKAVLDKYNIDPETKLLLYAPTFNLETFNGRLIPERSVKIDFIKVRKVLDNYLKGKWFILLRLHPMVAVGSESICDLDFVADLSDYPDSQELVAISDAVITDYSSIMFEPAFVRKPVFLFAPDVDEFVKKQRDFLIPYDTLPFPTAYNNEQLAEIIINFDYEKYVNDVNAFLDRYDVHEDGHASERVARFISDLIDGKEVIREK